MSNSRSVFPIPSLLVIALSAALGACSSGGSGDAGVPPGDAPAGGRLIYSVADVMDTLKMFDQTVATNRFTGTTVSAAPDAKLVLSNDGLTLAMLEGGSLSVVSSGLEHLAGSHPHTHDVSVLSPVAISGVSMVVATTDHFSILKADGSSLLLEAADGEESGDAWTDVVYPTLALEGGHFLKFTANDEDPSMTDITVVDENDATGEEGLIFVRPNVDGFFTESFSCTDGVQEAAQTEDFTVILCGDGTLRWMISGYEAPEGHPAAGQTIHVTQRYPATETRREGAIGEVTAGANGFIENITRLTTTRAEGDVIAAWAENQLWLVNGHGDHPHRGNLYTSLTENPNIVALAVTTEDDAMTVLADDGKAFIFRFAINESSNPVIVGGIGAEQLGSASATWSSDNAHLVAGAYDFFVINRDTTTLYHIDAHDPEDDYHLHSTLTHGDLADAHSAVFAHVIEGGHGHDH